MAALPPPAPAVASFVAAMNAFGGQIALQADLAPLATQAQLAATQAAMQAQLAAMQAQLAAMQAQSAAQLTAMQAQLVAMQAQSAAQFHAHLAAVQALLAPIGVPAIAAAATAIVRATAAARSQNAHDHRGVAFAVVPRDDGTLPPHWPAGFNREQLVDGPIGVIDTILADYGLLYDVTVVLTERRSMLAGHIGTPRL